MDIQVFTYSQLRKFLKEWFGADFIFLKINGKVYDYTIRDTMKLGELAEFSIEKLNRNERLHYNAGGTHLIVIKLPTEKRDEYVAISSDFNLGDIDIKLVTKESLVDYIDMYKNSIQQIVDDEERLYVGESYLAFNRYDIIFDNLEKGSTLILETMGGFIGLKRWTSKTYILVDLDDPHEDE